MTPEGRLKKVVKSILDDLPDCWYFVHVAGVMGEKGIPDIIGCLNGRFFGIELKAPGWKPPRPTNKKAFEHYMCQKEKLDLIRLSGGIGFFAQSVDEVIDGLGIRDRFLF